MKNSILLIPAFILLTLVWNGCNTTKEVFSPTAAQGTANIKGPEVLASVTVKIAIPKLIIEKNQSVTMLVPNRKSIQLILRRLDHFEKGRYAWYGEVADDPGSLVLISITTKAISGKIQSPKLGTFMIHYIGNGIHRIDEIDETRLPERSDDDIEVPVRDNPIEREKDCPDPARVDIMVVYTADAQTGAGGAEGMEAFIYLCIYFTNLSYQNSNVNLVMNLVHFEQITYTESGDDNTDLTALSSTSDGLMDNVHALRNTYAADLVSLITETLDNCGLAFRQFPVTAAFESSAFSVVKRSCAAGNLSFAHETAHNMGARHDCANASSSAGANHGHFVSNPADGSGNSWRTVLAYPSCTGGPCTRIPFFSNPNLNYSPTASASTDPMGTVAVAGSCTDDNVSVLNNASTIVSNFRCSSPGVTNVWMRDTWQDTGLEPDPATSGESMWRSPYIWIRNSAQDPTFIHQHEHENPVMGITNWIYVKLHNGGVADNGNLEIYYAQASVSLDWQSAWTLLTTVPVNINANSTLIKEIAWNSLPGTGHYCMVARYTSVADPIAHAETTDINNNTRQNNNIIWRNLNIEAMDPDADEKSETFYMQSKESKPISLKFHDDFQFPRHPFVHSGRITIALDKALFEQWKHAGSKGMGIRVNQSEIEIIAPDASIENLILPAGKKIATNIRFTKSKTTISDRYVYTVEQMDSNNKIKGGVSYEIYTYKLN